MDNEDEEGMLMDQDLEPFQNQDLEPDENLDEGLDSEPDENQDLDPDENVDEEEDLDLDENHAEELGGPEIHQNHEPMQPMDEEIDGGDARDLLPAPPPRPLPKPLPKDWEYSMRREMQEIIPGLFLGPFASASKLQVLQESGITHIVCVRHISERNIIRPLHENDFTYLVEDMQNDQDVVLIPHCTKVIRFIDNCFAAGGKVLVHGNAGVTRSAVLVTAYIMAAYGVSMKAAQRFVISKRMVVIQNNLFNSQLQEVETSYQDMHFVPHPLPADGGGEATRPPYRKRAFEL